MESCPACGALLEAKGQADHRHDVCPVCGFGRAPRPAPRQREELWRLRSGDLVSAKERPDAEAASIGEAPTAMRTAVAKWFGGAFLVAAGILLAITAALAGPAWFAVLGCAGVVLVSVGWRMHVGARELMPAADAPLDHPARVPRGPRPAAVTCAAALVILVAAGALLAAAWLVASPETYMATFHAQPPEGFVGSPASALRMQAIPQLVVGSLLAALGVALLRGVRIVGWIALGLAGFIGFVAALMSLHQLSGLLVAVPALLVAVALAAPPSRRWFAGVPS